MGGTPSCPFHRPPLDSLPLSYSFKIKIKGNGCITKTLPKENNIIYQAKEGRHRHTGRLICFIQLWSETIQAIAR